MAKKLDIDNSFSKLADTIKQQKESAESQYSFQKKELSISEITNLEQATTFIKKRDREVYINMLFLAHTLKKVRNEKLYLEKYDSFENYYTNELNYERRSIYNFLKIADFFPLDTSKEIVQLGVRKLLELSNPILTEEERKKYIEENALQEKSSAEIKEELKGIINTRNQYNSEVSLELINIEANSLTNTSSANLLTSISTAELKVVDSLYSNFNAFFNTFGTFKQEQNCNNPLERENIESLRTMLKEVKRDLTAFTKMLSKYSR